VSHARVISIVPSASGALPVRRSATAAVHDNRTGRDGDAARPLRFEGVYASHEDFVCVTLRRLDVPEDYLEDAMQDVFVVVHRRLGEFDRTADMRSWLFGIALRVARNGRRRARRKGGLAALDDELADTVPGPLESAARSEGLRILNALLDELDDERREVFVMAELEQMSVPTIAELLDANVNTVYSRLRAARADFERAVARRQRRSR
jgi:RNA polymerase sigma-70 factor (ECF subfamily)